MELDDIFNSNASDDELVAFLTAYIPKAFKEKNTKKIPKIDSKKMDELIMSGPENYIEPICVEACKILWNKNIFALGTLNIADDLYLILDKLDNENMKIFRNKYKENTENYFLNLGSGKHLGIKLADFKKQKNASKRLKKLAEDFVMQDIQRGYMTEKTFLMNICNCEKVEGLKEYKKQDLQVVFDINKMEKSFKEYLQETNYSDLYVPKEHRIYINEYYFKAHQNYKDSIITV